MKEVRDAPEAEEIDRIAQRVHDERSDDFTLKWSKQTSKHRNSARGSVRTLIAAMKAVGYAPLTKRRELLALTAERDALLSRVERLEKALKPFADYAAKDGFGLDNRGNPLPDGHTPGWVYVTNGDFRTARAALQENTDGN